MQYAREIVKQGMLRTLTCIADAAKPAQVQG